jgi:hypothetical protein
MMERVKAAKFQHRSLQGLSCALRQHPRRLDPSDQIDHANFRTIKKLVRDGTRLGETLEYELRLVTGSCSLPAMEVRRSSLCSFAHALTVWDES